MVFKCQEDSFLKEFTTKVVKCEPTKEPITEYGKKIKFEGYCITLENTILFPAGGGQPHDLGFLNDVEVFQVLRKGEEAIHFTKEPIEVGTVVKQKLNWERRFDHMQQHSGQHLLSAILEFEHKLPTTSWWLGAEDSYIEVDPNELTNEIITETEDRCNQLIRDAVPVELRFCKVDDPSIDKAHSRGLPKDCQEVVRLIKIPDIDENLCCGTHVTNLCQLQIIKLIGADPGKRGKTNLRFMVGNRLNIAMELLLDREDSLIAILNNEPSMHEELVGKLQRHVKSANKRLNAALSELARFEVAKIKHNRPPYVFMYRREATSDFNRAVIKGLEGQGMLVVMICDDQDKPKEGQILIQGPEEHCNALVPEITALLKGKGAFKNGLYQGKVADLGRIYKCKKLVEDYFKNLKE